MTATSARSTKGSQIARLLNLILGTWLFVSAFLWDHSAAQRTNTWILGVLIAVFALAAMSAPAFRWVNTVLAVWLFISSWALPHHNFWAMFNNAVVAFLVFEITLVSVVGEQHRPPTGSPA
jgi:hypothetical protein